MSFALLLLMGEVEKKKEKKADLVSVALRYFVSLTSLLDQL